jgi:hypothetical protein
VELDAGHMGMLSHPRELAAIVDDLAHDTAGECP